MGKLKIAPSMMCADLFNLKQDLDIFIEQNIDYLHIDIMDGHYVPNFTLGIDFCRTLDSYCDIPLDIHLMIDNPDEHIQNFSGFHSAILCIHPEVCHHPFMTLQRIKDLGLRVGLALNPALPIEWVRYLLPQIDLINVMTVNPGYAGQRLIPGTVDKIRGVTDYIKEKGLSIEIEVDGNVSWENLPKMCEAGADVFVAGTSSIFSRSGNLRDNVLKFKSILSDSP